MEGESVSMILARGELGVEYIRGLAGRGGSVWLLFMDAWLRSLSMLSDRLELDVNSLVSELVRVVRKCCCCCCSRLTEEPNEVDLLMLSREGASNGLVPPGDVLEELDR